MQMQIFEVVVALIIGFFVGIYVELRSVRRSRKRRYKRTVSLDTYAKLATTVVMAHGMILTTWSYVLASFDKDPVVDVSTTIVREIVAPLIMYLATNTIMNIFEKNKMIFSVPIGSTIISKNGTENRTESEETEG